VLGLRTLPDALPGRTETIELWPFVQGEIDGRLDCSSTRSSPMAPICGTSSSLGRTDYADRVVRGGSPRRLRVISRAGWSG
jgi:hypothetical protein